MPGVFVQSLEDNCKHGQKTYLAKDECNKRIRKYCCEMVLHTSKGLSRVDQVRNEATITKLVKIEYNSEDDVWWDYLKDY